MEAELRESTARWWSKIKKDGKALVAWLRDQYHGEVTAADRIERYCASQAPEQWKSVLETIATQEKMHAVWVGDLLKRRGHDPQVIEKNERYWEEVVGSVSDFETAAGAAAHAEQMRLERIEVIANDPHGPNDVKNVFKRILRDERFHARAFAAMAGESGMERTKDAHERGLQALGLVRFAEAA